MKRIHPSHIGLILVVAMAILLGYFTAKANGATTDEQPPAWTLLKENLGKDPSKADAVDLGIALRKSLVDRPDLLIPLVQTGAALACKMPYKRAAMLMVVQIAVDARQDRLVDIVAAAYIVCPDGVRGVEDKLVVTPDYEIDESPKWTPPEFPSMTIFSPVTPVVDVRP